MPKKIELERVLVSETEIKAMVKKLAAEITRDYKGKNLLLIAVLRGAFIFLADLVREIKLPLEVDFIAVSSYGNAMESSGNVKIVKDVTINIEGRDVLIIEDIIDSGQTLSKLCELLKTRNPNSVELCTAFDKPSRRVKDIEVKYSGIKIPDEFVVGYGLDFAEFHRNYPELYVVKRIGGSDKPDETEDLADE